MSMTRSTRFDRSPGRRAGSPLRGQSTSGRASRTSSSSRRVVLCSNTSAFRPRGAGTTHGGDNPGRRHSRSVYETRTAGSSPSSGPFTAAHTPGSAAARWGNTPTRRAPPPDNRGTVQDP
jgi:hypothetical protein